ncbi:hypothetical protein GCM10025883_27270 [Mobilicoccus caccae]|uniref:Transposase n=1 Tax=Mobilicoccus caccae TaxID=1859295 RepID=A0ABQ6IU67_9MICO|nr:hypothetical protein GCM10025883_27270 [Mobilicoccus caccae]
MRSGARKQDNASARSSASRPVAVTARTVPGVGDSPAPPGQRCGEQRTQPRRDGDVDQRAVGPGLTGQLDRARDGRVLAHHVDETGKTHG